MMSGGGGGVSYALYAEQKIKMVASSELLANFPEALVQFLEDAIVFSWLPRDFIDNKNHNEAFVSACTNQGNGGIKYLLSFDGNQFLRVMTSEFALKHAANLVVAFLESNLDFDDCHPLINKCYAGKTYSFCVSLYSLFGSQ